MLLSKKFLIHCICVNLMLTGCAMSDYSTIMDTPNLGPTHNQNADDTNFSKKLQILVKEQIPGAKVMLVSDHFNILIAGQEPNTETQEKVIALIKRQAITRQVWDYTTIQPEPKLHYNSKITEKAQDRLNTEYNITQDTVTAVAIDSVVYIMGEVNIANKVNMNDAMPGVYAIEGVIKVVSLVQYHNI